MTIIDVSRWQGLIDWPRVRAAGVTTAIMRATLGSTGVDDRFATNWWGSRAAGIPRQGVYHYVITGVNATSQVANILRVTGGDFGNEPLTLDCERTAAERQSLFPFQTFAYTAMLRDMLNQLAPYATGGLRIYTSKVEWEAMTTRPGWASGYLHWLAHYSDHIAAPNCPAGWAWDWWQYTSAGHVDGIAGNVDLSRARPDDTDVLLRAGIGAQAGEILRLVGI